MFRVTPQRTALCLHRAVFRFTPSHCHRIFTGFSPAIAYYGRMSSPPLRPAFPTQSRHTREYPGAVTTTLPERPWVTMRLAEMAQKAGCATPELVTYEAAFPALCAFPQTHPQKIGIPTSALPFFTDRELVAIMGHELSHLIKYSQREGVKIGAAALSAVVGVGAVHGGEMAVPEACRTKNHSHVCSAISRRAFIGGGATAMVVTHGTPAINRLYESKADHDSATLSGDPEAMITALQKLKQWMRDHKSHESTVNHPSIDSRTHALGARR